MASRHDFAADKLARDVKRAFDIDESSRSPAEICRAELVRALHELPPKFAACMEATDEDLSAYSQHLDAAITAFSAYTRAMIADIKSASSDTIHIDADDIKASFDGLRDDICGPFDRLAENMAMARPAARFNRTHPGSR